jgi:hypothetical protein
MANNLRSSAGLTNDQEAAPKIPLGRRIASFASWGIFVVPAYWQAEWLLRAWIQTGNPSPTFTTTACVLAFGPVIFLAWMATALNRQYGVRLSEQGISILTLRGWVLVPWSEIERARIRGLVLRLWSATHYVVINPFVYAQPAHVPPFVKRHLPAHILRQLGSWLDL